MQKKPAGDGPRHSPFALVLVMAGCCAIIVIGLCAPVARAELISSGLVALAVAWFSSAKRT
jgi:hypothetical protein